MEALRRLVGGGMRRVTLGLLGFLVCVFFGPFESWFDDDTENLLMIYFSLLLCSPRVPASMLLYLLSLCCLNVSVASNVDLSEMFDY